MNTSTLTNITCADVFDRQTFLTWAYTTSANITEFTRECQGVCNLFYGTGNPDISGIGVVIAYYIQIGITSITGPLPIIASFIPLSDKRRKSKHYRSFISSTEAIHAFITATNIFTAFTIGVSSIVRLHQNAFLFELMFMEKLNQLQILVTTTSIAFLLLHCFHEKRVSLKFVAKVGTPGSLIVFIAMAVVWSEFFDRAGKVSPATLNIYHEIIDGCVAAWHYEPLGLQASKVNQAKPSPFTSRIANFFKHLFIAAGYLAAVAVGYIIIVWLLDQTIQAVKRRRENRWLQKLSQKAGTFGRDLLRSIGIVFGVIFVAVRTTWKGLRWITIPIWRAASSLAKKLAWVKPWLAWSIFTMLLLSTYLPPALLFTIELARDRRYMQTASATSYGDNQWGFGQIAAVLVWAPAFVFMIDTVLVTIWKNGTAVESVLPVNSADLKADSAKPQNNDAATQTTATGNEDDKVDLGTAETEISDSVP